MSDATGDASGGAALVAERRGIFLPRRIGDGFPSIAAAAAVVVIVAAAASAAASAAEDPTAEDSTAEDSTAALPGPPLLVLPRRLCRSPEREECRAMCARR